MEQFPHSVWDGHCNIATLEECNIQFYKMTFKHLNLLIVFEKNTVYTQQTSWWRRLQDVLMKANISLLIIRLQKTSSRRLGQDQYIRLVHTSSRRLQDVFKTFSTCLQDIFKTSSRRLHNVFKTSSNKYVLKTSWRRFEDVSSK